MKRYFKTILASAALLSLVSGANALTIPNEGVGRVAASLLPASALAWIAGQGSGVGFNFDTPINQAICRLSLTRCGEDPDGVTTAQAGPFGVIDGFTSGDGGVYLFDTLTQTNLLRLRSAEAEADAGIGGAVAVGDNLVAVGGTGAVYLFDGTTGASLGKFTDPAGAAGFGYSVALRGKTLAVGAPDATPGGGLAYLFDSETGDVLQRFAAPDGVIDFGSDVAFGDGVVAVLGNSAGAGEAPNPTAYLFDQANGSYLGAIGAGQAGNPFATGTTGTTVAGASAGTGNSLAQQMPPAVPLPAPLWLLLAAIGGTVIARRKSIV